MGFLQRIINRDVEHGETLCEDLRNIIESRGKKAFVVEYFSRDNNQYVIALNSRGRIAMAYDSEDPLNIQSRMIWGTESEYSDFVDSAAALSTGQDTNRYYIFSSNFSHSSRFVDYLNVIYYDYTLNTLYKAHMAYESPRNIQERKISALEDADLNKMTFFDKSVRELEQEIESNSQKISKATAKIMLDDQNYGVDELIVAQPIGLDMQEDIDKLLIAAAESDNHVSLEEIRDQATGFLWSDILSRIAVVNERGWLTLLSPDFKEPISSFNSSPRNIPEYRTKAKIRFNDEPDYGVVDQDFATNNDFEQSFQESSLLSEHRREDDVMISAEDIENSDNSSFAIPPTEETVSKDQDSRDERDSSNHRRSSHTRGGGLDKAFQDNVGPLPNVKTAKPKSNAPSDPVSQEKNLSEVLDDLVSQKHGVQARLTKIPQEINESREEKDRLHQEMIILSEEVDALEESFSKAQEEQKEVVRRLGDIQKKLDNKHSYLIEHREKIHRLEVLMDKLGIEQQRNEKTLESVDKAISKVSTEGSSVEDVLKL